MTAIYKRTHYPKLFETLEEILEETKNSDRNPICRFSDLISEERARILGAYFEDNSSDITGFLNELISQMLDERDSNTGNERLLNEADNRIALLKNSFPFKLAA